MNKNFTIIVSSLLFIFVFSYVFLNTSNPQIESQTYETVSDFKQSSDIQTCAFATDGCNIIRIIDGKFWPATHNNCAEKKQYSCVEYSGEFIW